jgi:hypothetical protein
MSAPSKIVRLYLGPDESKKGWGVFQVPVHLPCKQWALKKNLKSRKIINDTCKFYDNYI